MKLYYSPGACSLACRISLHEAGIPAAFELFVSGKLDALAGLKPRLLQDVQRLPGARLLDGRFTAVQQAIGVPKPRPAAAAYVAAFVDEITTSGLLAAAIERHHASGLTIAGPPRP